jgi:3'-5' exoribonuclease
MRQYVGNLADGDAVDEVYLAADKQLRVNRNGNSYLQLDLRDRTGGMSARLWNVGEPLARTFEPGDFLRVRGKVQLYQGALQMILTAIDRVEPSATDAADFLPQANADTARLLERLRTLLRSADNPHLKALAECFLMDDAFMGDFATCPAGVKAHHAYVGGLLEHVVTLMEAADRLAPIYPMVDRDLWLVGLFLHDVGKVRELSYRQSFAYTDEGQLVGHLVQGVQLLNEKAAQAESLTGEPFPAELLLRLQHVIVSHHGELEFGSPKLPQTMEAVAVYALDNLDAKLNMVARELREDRGSGPWTQYNPTLQRRFFKGGRPGAAENGDR